MSGFTLVEVMTSLAIMSILITVSSSVMITSFNIFGKNSVMRAAQNEGNNIYNFLYDRLSYATSLKISEDADIINSSMEKNDFVPEELLVVSEDGNIEDISSYYEKITISQSGSENASMKLERKNMSETVYIYGGNEGNDGLYGAHCIVSFAGYTKDSNVIILTVTLERDGDILYTKTGSIPLLNDTVNSHIKADDISNETSGIEIFYTYYE